MNIINRSLKMLYNVIEFIYRVNFEIEKFFEDEIKENEL